MRNPLIIGQAPSRKAGTERALDGRSGKRLADAMGVEHARFLELFDTANVFDRYQGGSLKGDYFPIREARERARGMRIEHSVVVLLGQGVARSFLKDAPPVLQWFGGLGFGVRSALVIPHPSGVSLSWNDPSTRERSGRMLWEAVALSRFVRRVA